MSDEAWWFVVFRKGNLVHKIRLEGEAVHVSGLDVREGDICWMSRKAPLGGNESGDDR